MTNNPSNIVVKGLAQQIVNPKPATIDYKEPILTKRKSKVSYHLSQIKKSHHHFKGELRTRLSALDDSVYNLTQGQQLYQQCLISLATSEDDTTYWEIGALVIHRQLRDTSEQVLQQPTKLQQWVKG